MSCVIPDTMQAAVFYGRQDVRIEERSVPAPGPHDVLVAVAFCGVCGSDVSEYNSGPHLTHVGADPHPVTGHLGGVVLGHEWAGFVVARGQEVELSVGSLIACGGGVSCHRCAACRRGRTNLCERYYTTGLHIDGGLAQYCVAPAEICVDAGALGVDPYVAGLAQPMAIAVHTFRQGAVEPDKSILIVGAGGIGAFLTYVAAEAGAEVTVVDIDPARLDQAAVLGAHRCFHPDELRTRHERDFDCTFEVSGSPRGLEVALESTPLGGRLVAVGVQKPEVAVPARQLTLGELELIGTCAHAFSTDFPEALRVLATRTEGWGDIAPRTFPLKALVSEGLRPHPGRIKTLFAPWSETDLATPQASVMAADTMGFTVQDGLP